MPDSAADGLKGDEQRLQLNPRRWPLTTVPTAPRAHPRAADARPFAIGSLWEVPRRVGNKSVVSFDVFDTLISRPLDPPELLHEGVARFAQVVLRRAGFSWPVEGLLALRADSVSELRGALRRQGLDGETRLDEIWGMIVRRACGAADCAGLARQIVDYEVDLERRNVLPDPNAHGVLTELRKRGHRIVALSDMYLRREHIEALLEVAGLLPLIERVLVSCEYRAGKYSGQLFHHLLAELGVKPVNVLHVGDNHQSDVLSPRQICGIDALWLRDDRQSTRRARAREQLRALGEGKVVGALQALFPGGPGHSGPAREGTERRALFEIGFQSLGPAFYSFADESLALLDRNDVEDVYFIARDGYLLKKLHEIVRETSPRYSGGAGPRFHYLYASRHSTDVPGDGASLLSCLDRTMFRKPTDPIGPWLRGVGFEEEEHAALLERCGLKRWESLFVSFRNAKLRESLSALEWSQGIERRERLAAYLEQEGFFSAGVKAFVDTGWNATIQVNVTQAFHRRPDFPHLLGVYFGRHYGNAGHYSVCSRSRYCAGLMFDALRHDPIEHAIGRFLEIFELAASGPHGTTTGYAPSADGTIEPVLRSAEPPSRARELFHGVIAFAEWFARIDRNAQIGPELFRRGALEGLARFLERPTRAEVRAVATLQHDVDWGSDQRVPIVASDVRTLARAMGGVAKTVWVPGSRAYHGRLKSAATKLLWDATRYGRSAALSDPAIWRAWQRTKAWYKTLNKERTRGRP